MRIVRFARAAAIATFAIVAMPGAASAQLTGEPQGSFASDAIGRDFIIGAWTDSGDCAAAVAFEADGSLITPGGDEGQWELVGDNLVVTGARGETRLHIIPLDQDTMEMVAEDGAHGRSTRCAETDTHDPDFVATMIT
jgi:hypothetical protein